jgi:hypothetical protein
MVCGDLILGRDKKFFCIRLHPDQVWGQPSLLASEYQRLFPLGVKLPGREADHSSPFSVEVKYGGPVFPLPNTSSWFGA